MKTSRVTVRISDVLRGKLMEETGDYGTLSNVLRVILARYFAHGNKKPLGRNRKAQP